MAEVMALKTTLIGQREVIQAFERLDASLTGKTLRPAAVAGSLLIRNQASVNAPFITGTLRRSLHVGGHTDRNPEGFDPSEGYSDIGGEVVTLTFVRVDTGTNLEYAARVEFGFTGVDALGRKYNQPAKPYLRPAFDQRKEDAYKEFLDAVDELVQAVGSF